MKRVIPEAALQTPRTRWRRPRAWGGQLLGDITENDESYRELLKLPRYVVPAAMLVMGCPTGHQRSRRKPIRFRVEDVAHENSYDPDKSADMPRMLRKQTGKSGQELEDNVQRFCQRKWNSDFSRKMSRSRAAMARDWLNE